MNIPIDTVEVILKKATKKGQKTYDRLGLHDLAIHINEQLPARHKPLGKRYLYETLYLGVQKARKFKQPTTKVEEASIHSVLYFLGYEDLSTFRMAHFPAIPDYLYALEGSWLSIVRCNSGRPDLLVSPVRISIENDRAVMELRGPQRTYSGIIKWIAGSISSYLSSEDGVKVLHLVFQVGVARQPSIIQGVFSSISSSGHPIAGKEILMRSTTAYESLPNFKINIDKELHSPQSPIPTPIIQYFSAYEESYIKITEAGTFDLDGFSL